MKPFRRIFFLVTVLTLAFASAVSAGDDGSSGALEMARYFPDDTLWFAAAPIPSEADIDQMVAWNQMMTASFAGASGTSAPDVRQQLDMALASIGTDLDEVLALAGGSMAAGITGVGTTPSGTGSGYIVIEIQDQATTADFLRRVLPPDHIEEAEDDTIVFSRPSDPMRVAVSSDALFMLAENVSLPDFESELSLYENADFQATIASLPASDYTILAYVDMASTSAATNSADSSLPLGKLALGTTSLDPKTGVIDMAYVPGEGADIPRAQSIDLDFARYIPADASIVLHGTDLTTLYTSVTDLASTLNGAGSTRPEAEFEEGLRSVGIDWQEDVMSWTTGDYALFVRIDTVPVLRASMNNRADLTGNLDYGLVIEATDAAQAAAFAEQLGALVGLFTGGAEGVEVTNDTLNNVDVTLIHSRTPFTAADMYEQELAIGATDDVFFVSTRDAVTAIVTGDGVLANNPAYMEASQYFLPEPTFLWYGTGEGATVSIAGVTVSVLAMLGPAIGNVFDEVVAEMEVDSSTSEKRFLPQTDPVEEMVALWEASIHSIDSASLSATTTDSGVLQIRIAATQP